MEKRLTEGENWFPQDDFSVDILDGGGGGIDGTSIIISLRRNSCIPLSHDENTLAIIHALILEPLRWAACHAESNEEGLKLARMWARSYREVYRYRFIVNNVQTWFDETLIAEGLILEAKQEGDYLRLLIEEKAPRHILEEAAAQLKGQKEASHA